MKKMIRQLITASVMLLMLAGQSLALTPEDSHIEKVVGAFVKNLDSLSVEKSSIADAKTLVNEMGLDSPDSVTEGLIKLYPSYAKAIDASDVDDIEQAAKLLTPFADSKDKYLAADAGFYLARTLMNHERYEEAITQLEALNGEMGEFSVHRSKAQYFIGVAQAGLLKNQEAVQSFMNFLSFNPDAPERLRVSAYRQVQQIQSIKEGKLDDVYQRMDYSRRRLTLKETGDQTQVEQDKIVNMLTKLIKEEEKKECSSNCKKGGT
jgi:tetratricopeptide (TPR) repeat protein